MRNDRAVAELREYRRKRDPRRTPEPFGGRRGHGQKPTFVVQRHSARSLHYDLRLERDGALASWAVPKALPREPGSRRLAVHVEDHPLEYATFEGEIPQGQYGGGTVDVYDRGTYEVVEEKRDGTLTFRLEGERLHGLWTLVPPQRAGGAKDRWLLVKRADTEGAEPARRPRYLPMLATLAPDPPRGRGWLFEVKWDGYRTIARLAEGEPLLTSRRGQDLTERFEQVARQLGRALRVSDAVVDGEVCSLDRHGRPSFQLLQGGKGRLAYFVFDLLELDGEPLLDRPLSERRALLEEILAPHRTVVLSDAFDDGADLLDVARAQGLEGIVAKRRSSRYHPGTRSSEWLKVKARFRQEFLVAGYVRGKGRRERLGSLVLALRDGGGLVYAGNVGAGLTEPAIDDLLARLEPLRRETPPFPEPPNDPRLRKGKVVWAEPRLVAEVEFAEWTDDGRVRAPAFKGLREDKAPREVVRESPGEAEIGRGRRRVRLTRLDRVLWRQDGITKGALLDYYRAVAPVLLPHLRDRPFTMRRYFTVVGGPCEWVKDAPPEMPDWIPVAPLPAKSRAGAIVRYPLVNDELALAWMVEYGCIDLHVWQSRADRPERPDCVLFDLDPSPGSSFADAVRVAQLVRQVLEAVGLESVPRTSGGEGLHVLVPIERRSTHEEARLFATAVASALARTHPGLVTTQWAKARRRGVYVDAKMNGHGQQIVATYSVRPRAGAPVATPLAWDEVGEELDPAAFTMEAVLARVERHGDLAAPLLRPRRRLAAALARLGV